jgi:glucokinase
MSPSAESCAIGLDVGGTKIAGGLVLLSGQAVERRIIETRPERGGQAVLDDALKLAQCLLETARTSQLTVMGIGVGVPELVDLDGNVTSTNSIAWTDLPVQAAFARLAPAVVESDVRALALAEALYGAGQPFRIFTYVTIGTGISYSLVQDRRPYTGARCNALTLASSPPTMTCNHCGVELAPVLEEIASGPGLVSRYNEALRDAPGERLDQVSRGEEVMAAVEAGDGLAIDVVKSSAGLLGVSVGWLVNVLDPEAVIVGGGLGMAGGLYWDHFVASSRAHIWSETNKDLPILPAGLGVDAGFIGAAATILRRQADERDT